MSPPVVVPLDGSEHSLVATLAQPRTPVVTDPSLLDAAGLEFLEALHAGRIASGEASIDELGWELFHFYLDVASGKKQTWAERHKLYNDITLFNPAPIT